jgi:hypothetical protein
MPYYLNASGNGDRVHLATPFSVAAGQDFEIEFEVQSDGGALFGIRVIGVEAAAVRIIIPKGANPSISTFAGTFATSGVNSNVKSVYVLRRVSNSVTLWVNGVQQGAPIAYSTQFSLNRILTDGNAGAAGNSNPSKLYYVKMSKGGVLERHYNPSASNGVGNVLIDTVGGFNGDLVGFPTDNSQWVEYAGTPTPIAFNGSVPNQTATVSTAFSLNLSTFFSGTQAPFSYALIAGTLPAGLTLNTSTGVISGTPTAAATASGLQIRATDAGSNTAQTNTFSITVNAAAQPPQGTVTIGMITTGQTTASVPYTYSAADQTGFQYRLNGGSTVPAPASPINLLSLTANTAYTIEVRAINAVGNGTWSAVSNFTTEAIPQGTISLTALCNNAGIVYSNQSGITCDVYNPSNGNLVVRISSLTTDASGNVSLVNASIIPSTTYDVVIRLGTARGIISVVAT